MGPTSWWGISITSKCKDIDSAVKFLDYLFSKEGTYLYYLGVKGVTYEIAKDGTIRFTQKVIDEAKKANMDLDTYLATNYGINLILHQYTAMGSKTTYPPCKGLWTARKLFKGTSYCGKESRKV
jgi:ABC-type glycerol-3-phosphate transport system substrate-binding protein